MLAPLKILLGFAAFIIIIIRFFATILILEYNLYLATGFFLFHCDFTTLLRVEGFELATLTSFVRIFEIHSGNTTAKWPPTLLAQLHKVASGGDWGLCVWGRGACDWLKGARLRAK